MRTIKLTKKDDISQAIQIIRNLKDDDVVFELEKGSPLLTNSTNLKLIKKTGESMGKKIRIRTNDPTGRVLSLKAEILEGSTAKSSHQMPKVKRSDVRPRFSDILIPKKSPHLSSAKVSKQDLDKPTSSNTYLKEIKPAKSSTSKTSFSKIFVISMVVLVLLVFGLSVLLPSATVTVYARSEPISRDLEVIVDKNVTVADTTKFAAPGSPVSREVTQTKNFPTTGTKVVGTKATGSVTLYNFTTNTLTLKASTTTLVFNGKKFVFTKDVTGLRPTARIGSGPEEQIDQSSLIPPVPIVAVEVGAESNLVAGTKFTVQNAALGNTPNVVAANDQAFAGGTSHNVQVLSQQDLDKAVAAMSESVATQAQADLNSEDSATDVKVLPEALTKEVLAKTANKNVGDEVSNFDMTMIAKISGLAYHEDDIKKIVIQQIQSVLSDDKYLLPDTQQTLTAKFKSVDLVKGGGVLSVHFETMAAYKVNEGDMSKQLAGKSATQIKEILLSKPEIDRVDVEFSPFFVNKAPRLNGKIYIHSMLSGT